MRKARVSCSLRDECFQYVHIRSHDPRSKEAAAPKCAIAKPKDASRDDTCVHENDVAMLQETVSIEMDVIHEGQDCWAYDVTILKGFSLKDRRSDWVKHILNAEDPI
jgi:hypothetical protein